MTAHFPGTGISIKSDGVTLVDLKWDKVPVLFAFLAKVEISIMWFQVILHIDVRITYRCNIESASFNTIINLES